MNLALRISRAGLVIGFMIGIYEGFWVMAHQSHASLWEPAASPAIMALAPLVDATVYALWGGVLGMAGALVWRASPERTPFLVAVGLATPCIQLSYLPLREYKRATGFPLWANAALAVLIALVVFLAVLRWWPMVRLRCLAWEDKWDSRWQVINRRRYWFAGAGLAGLASLWVSAPAVKPPFRALSPTSGGNLPNIVLIALDTARADHLSAYGYPKPTTPNLDRLASQGTLFENAVAPSSWTLPSFAAVLTGLLPHQSATALDGPLGAGFLTLPGILRCRGYETAGFNANSSYGSARSGLAQGFDVYDNDDGTMLSNLASLSVVKAFWFGVYFPFIRPQPLPRRDAPTLNHAVMKWLNQRSRQPFFLMVNYFDAHDPYMRIPEIGDRFGNARTTFMARIRSEIDETTGTIDPPQSPAEQAALIAGYDSSIAFADHQIGDLLRLLGSSREWSNTYVIVFGDHGQSLGEHGQYGHLWGLGWELLHVPLIVVGPGIPPGRRIDDPVSLQQLFATVLDLAAPQGAGTNVNSLRFAWTPDAVPRDQAPAVVSEFVGYGNFSISLVTPGRHLVRDAAGNLHLYDLATDPGELENLADVSEHQAEVATLQNCLLGRIRASAVPWPGEEYLWALGEQEYSELARQHRVHTPWPAKNPQRTASPDRELLRSLPYD